MTALYVSRTRATEFEALPAVIRAAVSTHVAERQFDVTGARCWLTHSENPPGTGLFASFLGRRSNPTDGDAEHWTLVLLHPTQLVLATQGEQRGCSVLSLPLAQASVAPTSKLASMLGAGAPSDRGLHVTGFPGTEGRPGTFMAKLGDDDAGAACYAAVEAAITAAKRGG